MFKVDWLQSALDDLTRAWLAADSTARQRITAAAAQIDKKLSADPFADSESRDAGRRVAFVPPLGLNYRLENDGTTVSILHVWYVRPRS